MTGVQTCALPISRLLDAPLHAELLELEKDTALVFHCHHGMRSRSVVEYLRTQGYVRVANLGGGIDRWHRDVDPAMPTY